LHDDSAGTSTDWILQTVTWGFPAYFQNSTRQLIHEHAQNCATQGNGGGPAEAVLDCTMRHVGA